MERAAVLGPGRALLGFIICVVLLVATAVFNSSAREAIVETVRGQTWRGDLVAATNAVVIDETNRVALSELRRLRFDLAPEAGGLARGKGHGLLGYYFGRTNFQGSALVRLDERIDFDWTTAEPAPGIPADAFSVIWSGDVEAPLDGTNYTFSIVADDLAELQIGSNVVAVVTAENRGREVKSPPLTLLAGTREPLLLKYQDLAGNASVKLYWSGPGFARRIIPADRLHGKSRLPAHTSELLADEGLLATYYKNPDFTGDSFTRVDPKIDFNWTDRDPVAGFNRTRFSVRWQGQLRADHSETYTFHVVGDEPVRVWLEGRPLILPGGQYYMTEVRESIPLMAGERYDVRIEAQSTSGNASMRVQWSSLSTTKNVVPVTHLQPTYPGAGSPAGAGGAKTGRFPRGLVLVNGSFIALPVERANDSVIRTGRWLRNNPISAINTAQIYCQPVSRSMIERIPRGRAGLLLSKGDFVDGEFRSLENGQVKIGSVLFGLKSYDANKDVLVVVLRDVRVQPFGYEIQLQDQSTIAVEAPQWDAAVVRFRDAILGSCQIEWSDVLGVDQRKR